MSTIVQERIRNGIERLKHYPKFMAMLDPETAGQGDMVVINNSFVFRDVKTSKADKFLSLLINESPAAPEIGVTSNLRFNVDFKRVVGDSANMPAISSLEEAVDFELDHLGHLVFLLIGEIEDKEVVETALNHTAFSRAVWDPTILTDARVDEDEIVIKRTDDEDLVWQAVADQYATTGTDIPEGLRDSLGTALDQLQDQAVARVRIPQLGQKIGFGITDAILAVLREQRDEYASAVATCVQGGAQSGPALNDVLRIAYNFASDATGFLRLIVSICDLKPIVLWGTIAEHYALSEAFHALPWSRSKKKPSLKNYQQTIADARNSAFHNLFPFRKSLRLTLPEAALGELELQIFSEHSKKAGNQLTYQDKKMVDILMEFTRARERRLSNPFWEKNLDVMDSTIGLFEHTNEFVKELAKCRAA